MTETDAGASPPTEDEAREERIRAEARAWLEEHWPRFVAEHGRPTGYDAEPLRRWQRVMADGGWGAPSWPVEVGGRGFGFVEYAIWGEEKARVGANVPFNVVGFGMAGPTIVAHGSDEQKQRWLPPMLRGETIWCQLFSEPGAGSDLAAVATRAVREGDAWIVTGQKVWSSQAHEADWGILLARHDFEAPKHRGLVYLVVDMRAPGVEVRPLRQMNKEAHFNEVFLNEVRVPDANRVAEPGEGWKVAMTTLLHERFSIGAATAGFTFPYERLVEIARERGLVDPVARREIAGVWTQQRLLELLNHRIIAKLRRGEIPSAEGSVLKLLLANLATDAARVGVRLLGGDGMVEDRDGPQHALLGAPAFHIGGGTDEVQRNLIAERVLGLPREPDATKTIPFSEVRGARP